MALLKAGFNWVFPFYWGFLNKVFACLVKCRIRPCKVYPLKLGTLEGVYVGQNFMARKIQEKRYQDLPFLTNSQLSGKWLSEFCSLGQEEHAFLEVAVQRLALSARAHTRILRLARTIADLEGQENISAAHLGEAINYRSLDRQDY